jgi:hypothetical protein
MISKQRRPLNKEENLGNQKNDENQGDIILDCQADNSKKYFYIGMQ